MGKNHSEIKSIFDHICCDHNARKSLSVDFRASLKSHLVRKRKEWVMDSLQQVKSRVLSVNFARQLDTRSQYQASPFCQAPRYPFLPNIGMSYRQILLDAVIDQLYLGVPQHAQYQNSGTSSSNLKQPSLMLLISPVLFLL